MRITIRKATTKDLPRVYWVEKRSYPPQLQATQAVLLHRFEKFGIWVAEVNGVVRGFFTCVPVYLPWPHPDFKKIIANRKPRYIPWFDLYEKGGRVNTLFVTSTAIESKFQNRGIGKALVRYSVKLARKLELPYRASALRCEYGKFYKKTKKPIKRYIEKTRRGELKDRFLAPYLKLGFVLSAPLRDYEPYKGSLGYNVFAYTQTNRNL